MLSWDPPPHPPPPTAKLGSQISMKFYTAVLKGISGNIIRAFFLNLSFEPEPEIGKLANFRFIIDHFPVPVRI